MSAVAAPRRLLRISGLCVKLGGIAPRTVRRLVLAGTFPPPLRLTRKVVMWDEAEVDAWLTRQLAGALLIPDRPNGHSRQP